MMKFFDDEGNEVAPENATHAIELEFNDDGTVASSAWFYVEEDEELN